MANPRKRKLRKLRKLRAADKPAQEIVEEVARRVAKRLLKAKRAQKDLNEALGKTKK